MNDIPPSTVAPPKPAAAKPAPAPAAAAAKPAPHRRREQQPGRHRRDAGGPRRGDLRSRDAPAAARARDVFELTDEMALPEPAPAAPAAAARVSKSRTGRRSGIRRERARAARRQPAFEPPPFESPPAPQQQILSRSTVSAVESAFNTPRQYRAEQQRANAGRSGQGNAAADAEILARRQSAGVGGAHRQGGNRAGFARTLAGLPDRSLESAWSSGP